MDRTIEETGENEIRRHVLREQADEKDFEQYRSFWLYRVKLAVLTDRWGEAMLHALQAVRAPPAPRTEYPLEGLYKHSHAPKPPREWRILTRTIAGRLKQLREKIHTTEALLWGDRSMATKEAFGEPAREMLNKFKQQLDQACEDSLKILDGIMEPDSDGMVAISRLRGDIHRYMQKADAADSSYRAGCKGALVTNYDAACCHMGLYALGQKLESVKPPASSDGLIPAQLPYLPMQLSRLYGGQADAKVHLGFEEEELRPPPLNAI